LLIDADTALYRAKEKGRGRFEYFTPELRAEVRLFKQTADLLQQAIPAKQFVPFYQPVVDAQTLRLSSVEALARWLHPEEGVLSPARFLQTAEKLNIVDQIDELILKQAVADLRTWSSQGITVPSVSVNVSYKRLRQNNLLKSVADLGIVPGTVNFEFLESIFLDEADDELTLELDFLRELGIGIDIDDFGTGHTSFVSLFKLNPRRLKIDRQLIGPITQSAEQRKIVRSIIGIARTLEIEVVAEGVETMGHVKLLQRMGCDYLQGYAVARPMSSPDLVKWTLSRELTNDELQKKHAS
jgi:EAL domain-containing protein (putative c-di-GMP-specific phosphodiesterase class I)